MCPECGAPVAESLPLCRCGHVFPARAGARRSAPSRVLARPSGPPAPRRCEACGTGWSASVADCPKCHLPLVDSAARGAPLVGAESSLRGITARIDPDSWNTKAIIAFILSFWTIIPGIVLGHVALSEMRLHPQRGEGLAFAALVLSYLALAVLLMALLFGAFD